MERAFRRWCMSASVKDKGEVGRVSNSAQLQEHFREANRVSSSTSCLLEAQNSPTTLSHWPKDLEEQQLGLSVSYAPCSQRCTRCIVMATIYGLWAPCLWLHRLVWPYMHILPALSSPWGKGLCVFCVIPPGPSECLAHFRDKSH